MHKYTPKWYKTYRSKPRSRLLALLQDAKHRAKTSGLEFSITIDDLTVPEFCPYFPTRKLEFAVGKRTDNSVSLDRIDNNKGYTKENVVVCCMRANRLKSDGVREFIDITMFLAARLSGLQNS